MDERRRDFVAHALLVLLSLAGVVVVATAWGPSIRATVVLTLLPLVPGGCSGSRCAPAHLHGRHTAPPGA